MCNKHTMSIMALLHPLRELASGGRFSRASLEVAPPEPHQSHTGRGAHAWGGYAGLSGGGPAPTDALASSSAATSSQEIDTTAPCFPAADDRECTVCFEEFEAPVMTPCKCAFACQPSPCVLTAATPTLDSSQVNEYAPMLPHNVLVQHAQQ